jgi:two-component system NtrC family sensor kinase
LASFIEKRLSLYRNIEQHEEEIDRLKTQLTQLQHFANIGTVSHMIAHEINNLLTPVKSYGTLALNNPDDQALAQKALQKAVRNSERAAAVMESMLGLAAGESQERDSCNLREMVDGVFACLCRDFSKDGITVDVSIPDDLRVWCVPVQIQQVMMNLILNAHEAMSQRGGQLSIRGDEGPDSVVIEVADSGDGIGRGDLKRIFDSFYTTKNGQSDSCERRGTGLGLAFCKKVVESHSGHVTVESQPGQGTTFRISLPKPDSGDA